MRGAKHHHVSVIIAKPEYPECGEISPSRSYSHRFLVEHVVVPLRFSLCHLEVMVHQRAFFFFLSFSLLSFVITRRRLRSFFFFVHLEIACFLSPLLHSVSEMLSKGLDEARGPSKSVPDQESRLFLFFPCSQR